MDNMMLPGTAQSTPGKMAKPTVVRHHHRHNLRNRFQIVKTLGQGTYGKVKLAVEISTGIKYAIKSIRKNKINSEHDLSRIRREIEIMATLSHPHIITVHEVFENKEKIILVMEYASGGELYDYINDRKGLYDAEACKYFRQIVSAVHYLHENGIVHRDLKLENIMLVGSGNAKIGDFGLANLYKDNETLNTFCGSPLYASPEIVNGRPYHGPEVDCWSLGVLLYTLVYGAMPFEGPDFKRLRKQITEGEFYQPANCSDASELIGRLLAVNPAKRATIYEICNHWWVNAGYANTPTEDILAGHPIDLVVLERSLVVSSDSDSDLQELSNRTQSKKQKPLKSILKKPKDKVNTNSGGSCGLKSNHSDSGFYNGASDWTVCQIEQGVDVKNAKSRVQDVCSAKSVQNKTESVNSELANGDVLNSDKNETKADAVFDSKRQPKRGILKNKFEQKNPSSNITSPNEDINISEYFESNNLKSLSSVKLPLCEDVTPVDEVEKSPNGAYDERELEALLDGLNSIKLGAGESAAVEKVEPCEAIGGVDEKLFEKRPKVDEKTADTSPSISQDVAVSHTCDIQPDKPQADSGSSPESDTCVEPFAASTPARRQLKGILKWHGKYSSTPDPTWRYSIGSQSSNSSGDILDFSYDSGDCENVLPGEPPPLPNWTPPKAPKAAMPSDEGCVGDVYDDIYNHLTLDGFLPENVPPLLNCTIDSPTNNTDTETIVEDEVMNKINMLDDAYFEEGIHRGAVTSELFHFNEVQQVYKEALKICKNISEKSS